MSTTTRDRWLAIVYAATIFVSAFLLFQVQPLVTKHILPWFGGTPAVWTVCMLFFQSVLLAGYVYAHWSQRLRPAVQVGVQLAIIVVAVAAVAMLSVLPREGWQPQGEGSPAGRILLMLVASVGLPFFVLATTAPLIQSWFARSFPGRVPYRLYALSNFGSLLALLSYPFLFERAFDLPRQAQLWALGFVAYGVLCAVAGLWLWRGGATPHAIDLPANRVGPEEFPSGSESRLDSPTWLQRLLWLLLPAFATVALLAMTNHVTTDVAAVPLLWVVPLALYLLTFIIAFDHPRWYRRTPWAAFTLLAIYGAALTSRKSFGWVDLYDWGMSGRLVRMTLSSYLTGSPKVHFDYFDILIFNAAAMFGFCMLCHGELVRHRPHPRYLTSFYLMIAAGGVLGGLFVTLVAPHVFRTYFEWRLFMFFGAIWALALVIYKLVQGAFPAEAARLQRRGAGALPLISLLVLMFPASIGLLDLVEYLQVLDNGVHLRVRNFFGTLAVREKEADDPRDDAMFLYHGAIAHGSQFLEPSQRGQPTTYYGSASGVGRTVNFYRRQAENGKLRVGVVGLGTGTLAAYAAGSDSIAFYEINPAVIDITEGGEWFTYLKDCESRGGKYEIKLGDARITLQRELDAGKPQRFHALVVDAFSGDAIPMHLLTAEAIDVYLQHLATKPRDGVDGALVIHVSNRYLDLEPVVRGAAEHFGIPMVCLHSQSDPQHGIYEADWIVLTKNRDLLQSLVPFATGEDQPTAPAILWTDDRSNLLDVVK